jgi:hypothetical protein
MVYAQAGMDGFQAVRFRKTPIDPQMAKSLTETGDEVGIGVREATLGPK